MKICYVASNLDSIHDQKLIGQLESRGHELHVVSFNHTVMEERDQIAVYQRNFGGLSRPNYLASFYKAFRAAQYLKGLLAEVKPDVLHSGSMAPESLLAAMTGYRPLLVMPWGSDILIFSRDMWWYRLMSKYTLQRAGAVMCDCQSVKDEIIRMNAAFGEKTEIIYYAGIDIGKFNTSVDGSAVREKLGWKDSKILIMTRSFRPVYAVEYFIQALPEVVRQVPETRVLLCGEGPLRDKLDAMVAERSLEPYVHFTGWVDNDNLPRYLNAADVYVSTSLSDGTSSCLMEALCCGLPVVISDVPANLEWIEDGKNGFVVPRRDSTLLAERLVALLNDESLRREFSERNAAIGRERASLAKNIDKLDALYRRLARNRRTQP